VDYTLELMATAPALAAPGKEILAVDESSETLDKRLAPIGEGLDSQQPA